jgi:hypothetical protein
MSSLVQLNYYSLRFHELLFSSPYNRTALTRLSCKLSCDSSGFLLGSDSIIIMAASIYEPLDVENCEIRMLRILPGPLHSVIKCTMTKTSLINPIKYAALSYCWGDPNFTTTIIVNNIPTQVRINLAEALQQLRENGVHRIWADALCINQADRQEKSNQIRVMKLVYERAEFTYAWIGKEDHDRAATAIPFLQTLADTRDDNILAYVHHTHTSPLAATRGRHETDNCQRCLRKSQFQALSNLFSREYWKRRWIIQELAVTTRAQILYAQSAITLDDFNTAVEKCRNSRFWHDSQFKDYEYYAAISVFRSSYKRDDSISLCRAIATTHRSLSTDPRDKVYALLGLCSDGPDLVPTPNYKQSVETVAMNLTRALIWKQCSLDIIFADQHSERRISALPSWAPDWFQVESFAQKALDFAEKQSDLDRSFLPQPAVKDETVLRVQGVIIGSIIDMTHPVAFENSPPVHKVKGNECFKSRIRPVMSYYGSRNMVLRKLLFCLIPKQNLQDIRIGGRASVYVAWHALIWHGVALFQGRPVLKGNADSLESGYAACVSARGFIGHWIQVNGNFPVEGKALIEWFAKKDVWQYLVWLFDGPYRYFLWLLFAICSAVPGASWAATVAIIGPFRLSSALYVCGLLFGSWLACVGVLTYIFSLKGYLRARAKSRKWQLHLRNGLRSTLESKHSLILSDRGFIGLTYPCAEIGDRICFMVGYKHPVLLREARVRHKVQYTIVGTVSIYLSRRHKQEHEEFMDATESKKRAELLQQSRRSGKYREFELI